MKKILILFLGLIIALQITQRSVFSQEMGPLEPSINDILNETVIKLEASFDWVNMTQVQRDEKIKEYHDLLFTDAPDKISRKDFKNKYKDFMKDAERKEHYRRAKNGVTELEDCFLCAFFIKNGLLISYGVQYKNDMRHAYYYDAYGNLRYVDEMSENYPNFIYHSRQYRKNGKLVSAIVFEDHDTQYMYNPNGSFKGLWYKDKMFDKSGKQLITRTNW